MSLDLTDVKSTLVQVMAWCLSYYWPRFMSPHDVTKPQWVEVHMVVALCVLLWLNIPRFLFCFFFQDEINCIVVRFDLFSFFQGEITCIGVRWVSGCILFFFKTERDIKLHLILFVKLRFVGICVLMSNIGETSWWRHEMETFSALLALCAGNSPVTGEFPSQRPVTQSLNKRLSKQCWGWWFQTPSCSLWRHYNGNFSAQTLFWFALAAE